MQVNHSERQAGVPQILFAEDDQDFRELVTSALTSHGYSVQAFPCGQSLSEALNPMRPPQLLICDHNMPGKSGLAVVDVVRRWGWTIPVFLVSAFAEQILSAEETRGVTLVVSKPFRVLDLVTAVACFVGERRFESV